MKTEELNEEEKKLLEEFRGKVSEFIPEKFFVDELIENKLGHIKMAFLRETINPFICRSTDAEASITFRLDAKRELIEVPARKFKSREKLLGLKICRKFGVVDNEVRYNLFKKRDYLANPNSVLFGDSVTQEREAAALPSRAIYDWAYSIRDYSEITDNLQHNALSESGTMWSEDPTNPGFRESLFTVQYVLPGTIFPHFITVDDITPELLFHLLFCVLKQTRYGAQDTTNAPNFSNEIVAIAYSDFEPPVNSLLIAKEYDLKETITESKVKECVFNKLESAYGNNNILRDGISKDKKLSDFINYISGLWGEKDQKTLKAIYKKACNDSIVYAQRLGIAKK